MSLRRIFPICLSTLAVTLIASFPAFPAQTAAQQATAAREANHPDDAIRLYRDALTENPKWTEGWWYLGTLFYDRDDFVSAAPAFQKAAALDPKPGTTWVMLGLSEAKLGQNDKALKHLEQGRELGIADNPQLRQVTLYNLATMYLQRGNDRDDFPHAQEALDALVRDGVESDDITNALGLAVLRTKPPGPSAALVREAGHAESLAAQREHSAEALAAYQHLAATYSDTPNVQFAFGVFLMARSFDERAVTAFQHELQNTPGHLLARLGIAGILSRSDPAAALPYAAEAVKLAPTLPEAHFLWGVSLVETGKLSQGIAELETAQRGSPHQSKIYFALGRAYARANRPADAARARATFQQLEQGTNSKPKPQ